MMYNSIKGILSFLLIISTVLPQAEKIVIGVTDVGGENISSAIQENIRDRLEQEILKVKYFSLVSVAERDDILKEQEFQQSCVSIECAAEVGQMVGAEYMLIPTINKIGSTGEYTATFKVIHTTTNKMPANVVIDRGLNSLDDVRIILATVINNLARDMSGGTYDPVFVVKAQKLYQLQFNINVENAYVSHGSFSPLQTIGNIAILKLASDEYTFRFEKNQYKTVTKLIRVSQDAQYSIQMVRDDSEIIPYRSPGMISINTKPQGAEILINNQRIGSTPYTGTLIAGNHVMDLSLAMYHTSTLQFNLEVGESEEINETLKPRFGFVTINTVPAEANVTIDNKPLGASPIKQYQLLDGKHEINITKNLYHSTSRVIEIMEGKSDQLTIQLDKAYGMFQVVTLNTTDADVYLDGIKKGKTPFENLMIASGTYLLEVKKEYFNSISEEIVISDERLTTRTLPMTTNIGVVNVDAGLGTLFIDDENKGTGKFELKLKPGNYTFKSEAANHYPNAKEIMVRAGDNTNLDLKPIPRLGSIAVFVTPDEAKNAEIYIDGELKGNAPKVITLTMGNYDVEIRHKDYLTANKGSKVKEGQSTELKFELLDYKGSLQQRLSSSKNMTFTTLGVAAASAFFRQGAINQSNEYFQLYNNANTQSNAVKYKELAQDEYKKQKLYTTFAVAATSATAFYLFKLFTAYYDKAVIDEREADEVSKSKLLRQGLKAITMRSLQTRKKLIPVISPNFGVSVGNIKPFIKYQLLGESQYNWIIVHKGLIAYVSKNNNKYVNNNVRITKINKKPEKIVIAKRMIKVYDMPTSGSGFLTRINKGAAIYNISIPRKGWYTVALGQGAIGYVKQSDVKEMF